MSNEMPEGFIPFELLPVEIQVIAESIAGKGNVVGVHKSKNGMAIVGKVAKDHPETEDEIKQRLRDLGISEDQYRIIDSQYKNPEDIPDIIRGIVDSDVPKFTNRELDFNNLPPAETYAVARAYMEALMPGCKDSDMLILALLVSILKTKDRPKPILIDIIKSQNGANWTPLMGKVVSDAYDAIMKMISDFSDLREEMINNIK